MGTIQYRGTKGGQLKLGPDVEQDVAGGPKVSHSKIQEFIIGG
jgi:hypothetical protein